jgi:hypothetical protein
MESDFLGPLAQELDDEFNEAIKKSPLYDWLQPEGDALGLPDIPQQEFMRGVVALMAAQHGLILRLANKIDAPGRPR